MPFTKKEREEFDSTDFTKLVDRLDSTKFAIGMHKRLSEETKITIDEKHQFDMTDINRILSRYPQYFSWALVESELIKEAVSKIKDDYEDWYNEKYNEISQGMDKKATIKSIEAVIQQTHKDEMRQWKDKLRDLETKVAISSGMVKVWGNAINSLQSLSKNITVEMGIITKHME